MKNIINYNETCKAFSEEMVMLNSHINNLRDRIWRQELERIFYIENCSFGIRGKIDEETIYQLYILFEKYGITVEDLKKNFVIIEYIDGCNIQHHKRINYEEYSSDSLHDILKIPIFKRIKMNTIGAGSED